MRDALSNILAELRTLIAKLLALFIVRRQYLSASEIRAALDSIRSELHDDTLRTHEPVQVPIGTFGLLTGQHMD